MKYCTTGIDIGGTNTLVGIVDKSGNCLCESSFLTAEYEDPKEFVTRLHREIEALLRESREGITLEGIGIGAPNGNVYRGSIEFAPNLRWKGIVLLVDLMKQFYSIPIVLTNDANAAAVGELMYGAARGMSDFMVITLGTGLGSGIVVNGELVYGHDGFAGEIGHTIVDPNGRSCGCGRNGCLETYASATGIKRTVFELLSMSTTPSVLRSISFADLTASMITEAAAQGDSIAREAFERTGKILGLKLADAVAHTNPEAIFLFGGLVQAGDFIFEPTRRSMEHYMLNIFKNKVKLLPSGLTEHAAILGASALVRRELST